MGRVFQEAAKPQSLFPFLLQPSWNRAPSQSYPISLFPAQLQERMHSEPLGLISHVGPKLRISHSLRGFLHPWLWLVTGNPGTLPLEEDGKAVTTFSPSQCPCAA